ncbi:hypothetical protein PIB30_018722 [Stylosanthes scabra]|uniref:Uncharacterized protein n=1 Tax=Stylosanthes scabra TaxID=79078 RepID=A0ABU6Y544_9FABA|nr:hypothetical protein [Stylosanthes scabra]
MSLLRKALGIVRGLDLKKVIDICEELPRGFGLKPVAIGYACGMVLGIGLGICVFSVGKPEWLVNIFI